MQVFKTVLQQNLSDIVKNIQRRGKWWDVHSKSENVFVKHDRIIVRSGRAHQKRHMLRNNQFFFTFLLNQLISCKYDWFNTYRIEKHFFRFNILQISRSHSAFEVLMIFLNNNYLIKMRTVICYLHEERWPSRFNKGRRSEHFLK